MRPHLQPPERDLGASDHGVDHIGHDGRRGGHLTGPQSVEEDRSDRIAKTLIALNAPRTSANGLPTRTRVGETCNSRPSSTSRSRWPTA
jgi:hypothetical protein